MKFGHGEHHFGPRCCAEVNVPRYGIEGVVAMPEVGWVEISFVSDGQVPLIFAYAKRVQKDISIGVKIKSVIWSPFVFLMCSKVP